MYNPLWRAVLVAALVVVAAAALSASGGSSVRVHVVRPAGVPPAAVEIVLVDRANDSFRRVVRVDDGDVVWFEALPGAVYELTAATAGAAPARGEVAVAVGWVSVVTVTFVAPGPGTSRVAVRDSHRSGEGTDFDDRALRDLPAGDLWSLVETAAPFVIVDRMDTGGLGTGRSALMGSRGESWALSSVSVDGLSVGLPTDTGRLAIAPDINAVAAVGVTSGLAPVDVASPGVTMALAPRRPGRDWQGGIDMSLTAPRMVGENALADAPSIGRVHTWRHAGAFAGGPITPRTGLFASAATTHVEHSERDLPDTFVARSTSVFAHLVANPGAGDQVRVLAAVEGTDAPFDARRQFRDVNVNERARFARTQAVWDHLSDTGARRTVSFGAQVGEWLPAVTASTPGGTMDRVFDGAVPVPPADTALSQVDGRIEWASPVFRLGGVAHDIRAGATWHRTTLARDIVALPVVAESVATLPARVWTPVAPGALSRRTEHAWSLFAADRVMPTASLTLDLGARVDLVRASARDAATAIRWTTVSPRVSFRWSPAAIAIFGGYGRYAGGHALSFLAYGDPGEATWNVARWNDPDADGRFTADEVGVLVARAGRGAGVASLDPDLRVPRTSEWTIGAEVRPGARSVLRAAIVMRRETDMVGVVNTGVPFSSYRRFVVPDINADEGSPADDQLLPIYERLPASFGQDALLLTNPEADPIAHDGIELAYTFSSARWFVLFGATAYRTLGRGGALGHGPLENDQLVLGDRFSNPNAAKDAAGRLFFDRAYVGKWSTGYRAPGDVRLAATVRYQDGQPFTRLVVAPDLAGGPEIVHAYPMGRTRFTYTATVDVRLEKGFVFGHRRASVRLDAFNLTNHANEVEEDVLSGPTFRRSTVVQPPRTLRLGIGLDF